jgi:hypothetical protein
MWDDWLPVLGFAICEHCDAVRDDCWQSDSLNLCLCQRCLLLVRRP